MIKEKQISAYFDKDIEERISLSGPRNDAIAYNYKIKRQWFVNHLKHVSGKVLDIGCNVGNLAFFLRQAGIKPTQLHYVGVDIAKTSINAAIKRQIECAEFHVGSGIRLAFPDESFEAVTLVEVIEHIAEQLAIMKEIARVLKPNGMLLLSTPNAECKPWQIDERIRFYGRALLGKKTIEKDNPLTLPELATFLTTSGFSHFVGPEYYWYRPYHILKGRIVFWPPNFVLKGLLETMKQCRGKEGSDALTAKQMRYYCQSIVAVAKKT